MIASQISVSRLLELGVPLSWQEAVAIAGEVAVLRAAGPGLDYEHVLVDADSCMLTATGDIELPRSSIDQPEDAEVQLLRALLAGRNIPSDLEAVAYGPTPAHLGDALAAFSRPNRRSAIAAVAARGLEAEAELAAFALTSATPSTTASVANELHAPVEGFDELRAQVAQSPDVAETRPEPPPPVARSSRVAAGKIAAAVAVFAMASAGVWAWSAWKPAPPAAEADQAIAPTPPVESRPSWLEAAGQRSADINLGRRRRARVTPRERLPDGALVDGTVLATPEADAADGSEPWQPIGGLAPPVAPAAPYELTAPGGGTANPAAADFDDTVYTRRTFAVQPPSMRFPRMPRSAFPPPDAVIDGQYVEVLVDKAGW